MFIVDTITSRLPVLAGFVGVTLAPAVVAASETDFTQSVNNNTTLIFQSVIAVVTVISEIIKFFAKRKANKKLTNI